MSESGDSDGGGDDEGWRSLTDWFNGLDSRMLRVLNGEGHLLEVANEVTGGTTTGVVGQEHEQSNRLNNNDDDISNESRIGNNNNASSNTEPAVNGQVEASTSSGSGPSNGGGDGVNLANVSRFRTEIGPDGEIQYVFDSHYTDSDNESEMSEGVTLSEIIEARAREEAARATATTPRPSTPDSMTQNWQNIDSDSDEEEDEDYIPPSSSSRSNAGQQTATAAASNRRARLRQRSSSSTNSSVSFDFTINSTGVTLGSGAVARPGRTPRTSNGRGGRRRTTTPRSKKPKKPTPARKKKPGPPPKPLKPKTVRRGTSCTADEKKLLDTLNPSIISRLQVNCALKEENPSLDRNDYILGTFDLQILEPVHMDVMEEETPLTSFTTETLHAAIPGIHQLKLYINVEENKTLLAIETEEALSDERCEEIKASSGLTRAEKKRKYYYIDMKRMHYWVNLCGIPVEMFRALEMKKLFRVEVLSYNSSTKIIRLRAVLLGSGISLEQAINQVPETRRQYIAEVVQYFCGVEKVETNTPDQTLMQGKEDITWFYEQIKKYHRQEVLPDVSLSEEGTLIPILRSYQKDAVKWMLCRERGLTNNINLVEMFVNKMFIPIQVTPVSASDSDRNNDSEEGHNYFSRTGADSKQIFYCPYFGTFAWKIPNLPPLPSGGILCDEMGLGKTVEVLCLVTLNQWKEAKQEPTDELDEDEVCEGDEGREKAKRRKKKKHRGKEKQRERAKEKERRGRSSKRKSEKSMASTAAEEQEVPRKRLFLSPTKRRRRNPSPCEFETKLPEPDLPKSEPEDLPEVKAENSPAVSDLPSPTSASPAPPDLPSVAPDSPPIQPTTTTQRKRKQRIENDDSNNESQGETTTNKRISVYKDLMKPAYEATLSQYSLAHRARESSHHFGGEFYNTNIPVKPCFECICGEGEESRHKRIVTCKVCQCSQHAHCVGFDQSRTPVEEYICPHCTGLSEPYQIKGTLIVTPVTISHQWIQEIQKHVKNANLKILFYKGVSEQGYIPPATLGDYDVIITTYNTLAKELDYVDLPHASLGGRQFRQPKRYQTIPSPLLSSKFWRICLDEAQMVEGTSTTKTAAMALRLKAIHRWCVTGTPMNKGLEDLYGLFAFLELQPINIEFWWNTFISKSFYEKENTEALFELFGQLVWRTCKRDVLHQLGIPPQTEILHWLKFSPLETHFYQRQFEICSEKIMEKINDPKLHAENENRSILDKKLAQLDRGTLNGFLQPFLILRQACVHPQMVKGNWITVGKTKGTLTMEDLLDQLIKKSANNCAEDNRVAVSALNAMAGLFIIRENYVEAATKYREVFQREVKYREKFKTDPLQMIHTLENLADLIDANHSGVGFTLRDDELRSDANELKQKYLETYAAEVKSSRNVVESVTKSIEKLESKLKLGAREQSWWVKTLNKATRFRVDEQLIDRIKDELTVKTKKKQVGSIINQFNDVTGLENVLVGKILEMETLRNSVQLSLTELGKLDPHSLVDGAVSCHLRKKGLNESESYYNDSTGGYKCTLCAYHDQFLQYESVLFAEEKMDKITRTGRNYQKFKLGGRSVDQLTEEELDLVLLQEQEELAESTEHALLKNILRHGTWGPSETERALKVIHSYSKLHRLGTRVIEDGANHIKLLEAAKKEFKLNRILWRKIYDQVSALDELDQATTRLRLATPAELQKANQPTTSAEPTPSTSTNRRKTKVPVSLQNRLAYTQESDTRFQTIHILKPHEVELKMHQSQTEFHEAEHQLALHLGQVMYLESLKKSGYGKKGTTNPDDCPVCTNPLGYEWSVMICGHSYCSVCVRKMCPNPTSTIQCPICRMTMKYADISFVDTKVEEPKPTENLPSNTNEPQPSTSKAVASTSIQSSESTLATVVLPREVTGSHSSKVGKIVETLLKLEIVHPGEKVIIFSSWVEVLEIIGRALTQNDIKFCLIAQGKKFQKSLEEFKNRPEVQVLLMPLSSGSKGLNIIEATHVFLVEPTLNLANELQAIGRVHRIGQTKPTYVHRFYVKNTIEEKLYEILRTQDVSSDEEGSLTVADLKNLVSIRR